MFGEVQSVRGARLVCAAHAAGDVGTASALGWLESWLRVAAAQHAAPAIVFDVDATLIRERDTPIEAAVRVYRRCEELGIACFVVTARLDFPEGHTELQHVFDTLGVRPVAAYMRPERVQPTLVELARFKAQCREDIEERYGVTIVGNIGDQWHDLVRAPWRDLLVLEPTRAYVCSFGAQTEVSVKLPE